MTITVQQIALHLAQNQEIHLPPESPYTNLIPGISSRLAAVLIPFIWKDNDWHLLFIRRSLIRSDHHGGQVAFPGGHYNTKTILRK